jgi:hypothetical protein
VPTYFFNFEGVDNLPSDVTGEELRDDDAARRRAVSLVREILLEGSQADWDMTGWRLIVTADDGRVVTNTPVEAEASRRVGRGLSGEGALG